MRGGSEITHPALIDDTVTHRIAALAELAPLHQPNALTGVAVDPARNDDGPPDREIGAAGAAARTLVVAAREDVEIARETRAVVRGA